MDIDQGRLQSWLATNWKHGACPVCLASEWSPAQRFGQISNLEFAGNIVPVLLIFCQKCGYTLAINALVGGLLPPNEGEHPGDVS